MPASYTLVSLLPFALKQKHHAGGPQLATRIIRRILRRRFYQRVHRTRRTELLNTVAKGMVQLQVGAAVFVLVIDQFSYHIKCTLSHFESANGTPSCEDG